jgi:hypothetical protein
MRLSKLPFCIAIAALLFLQFSAATSRADTYKIVDLGPDNLQFYGMDDSGHVVFLSANCGNPAQECYVDFLNGTVVGETTVAPTFAWDYTASFCGVPPCTISNNGRTAVIAAEPFDEDDLFVESGGNPPQFLATGGFTSTEFAINGLGDIVFDEGNLEDEWDEAIDLSTAPVPEPTSILLLGTGAIALSGMVPRRKRAA